MSKDTLLSSFFLILHLYDVSFPNMRIRHISNKFTFTPNMRNTSISYRTQASFLHYAWKYFKSFLVLWLKWYCIACENNEHWIGFSKLVICHSKMHSNTVYHYPSLSCVVITKYLRLSNKKKAYLVHSSVDSRAWHCNSLTLLSVKWWMTSHSGSTCRIDQRTRYKPREIPGTCQACFWQCSTEFCSSQTIFSPQKASVPLKDVPNSN